MIIHSDVEQNTEAWLKLRAGIPTASAASKLVTSTGGKSTSMQDYAFTLAGEKFAGEPLESWGGNKYTDRGHELEELARDSYALAYNCDPVAVAFITDDLIRQGCSPDALVDNDGMLEIKNLTGKEHVKVLNYYDKHGKAPSTYIVQCQFQMMTADKVFNDLFYHHPLLPDLRIRQTPDEKIVSQLKAQISAVSIERDRLVKIMERM